jgi:uncharacterized SAM-binding protein YcdF (DUF218 family)
MEAAVTYKQGWTHAVWLTKHAFRNQDLALARSGIVPPTEDTYNQQILERLGVPKDAIRKLNEEVQNTAEEVQAIARELQKTHGKRVILITSKCHTRRVRVTWDLLVGKIPEAIVRYTPNEPYDPDHWWRTRRDAMAASHEWLGLLNIGLTARFPSY